MKLRLQKPRTAALGVHEPRSPAHLDVHRCLAKGKKLYGPFLRASGPKTHGSELGGEVTRQEGEKRGGVQAAAPVRSRCLAGRVPSLRWGSAATFGLGAKGNAACRVSQNLPKTMGKERPWAPLGCRGIAWCQPVAQHRAALRTKGGWIDGQRG